jgi:hypothetical protein
MAVAIASYWQVFISRDTAKRQLRAYVTVKEAKLVLRNDGHVQPRVTFINSGQTPAYDIEGIECIRFDQHPFSETPPPKDTGPRVSIWTVGAGEPYDFIGRVLEAREHRLNLLMEDPEVYACVFNGWYTYRDVFRNPHWVHFQLRIGGNAPVQTGKDEVGEYFIFFNDPVDNDSD